MINFQPGSRALNRWACVSRKSKHRFISAVALFAMALRLVVAFLFVPTPVIPGASAEAATEVVLCTEHGPMQITLDAEGDGASDERQEKAPPVCPLCYAGACVALALPPPSTVAALSAGNPQPEPPPLVAHPLFSQVYAASARGPPSNIDLRT